MECAQWAKPALIDLIMIQRSESRYPGMIKEGIIKNESKWWSKLFKVILVWY